MNLIDISMCKRLRIDDLFIVTSSYDDRLSICHCFDEFSLTKTLCVRKFSLYIFSILKIDQENKVIRTARAKIKIV